MNKNIERLITKGIQSIKSSLSLATKGILDGIESVVRGGGYSAKVYKRLKFVQKYFVKGIKKIKFIIEYNVIAIKKIKINKKFMKMIL